MFKNKRAVDGWRVYLPAVIPLLLMVWLVWLYGLRVPFWDQWDSVALYEKFFTGNVTFQDFWAQHNEHRPFFPRFLMAGVAILTHWSHGADLAVNAFLALAAFYCFAIVFRRIPFLQKGQRQALLLFFASLCAFSIRQYENQIWGIQMHCYLANLLVLAGLAVLYRPAFSWQRLALSLFLGIAATFSFATGFGFWPAAFLMLCLRTYKSVQAKAGALILCAGAGTASAAVYLQGFHTMPQHPSVWAFVSEPVSALQYFLVLLGGIGNFAYAALLGAGGLFLVVLIFLSSRRLRLSAAEGSFFWGVMVFSLASGLLTLVGRAGFGPGQGFSSRYVTYIYPFWIGLFGLCLSAFCACGESKADRLLKSLFTAGLSAMLLAALLGSGASIAAMREFSENRMAVLPELFNPQDDELLSRIYPDPAKIRHELPRLRRLHISVFRDSFGEQF